MFDVISHDDIVGEKTWLIVFKFDPPPGCRARRISEVFSVDRARILRTGCRLGEAASETTGVATP